MSTVTAMPVLGADLSVMVWASHNSAQAAGFKLQSSE
ncbi:MAG: hypothetical protein ACLQNE_07510 [Thermoguttaceae bacterium]